MTRTLKNILKVTGVIFGLCILLWAGLIIFVHYNKDTFARIITDKINDKINGQLTIEKIDLTILKDFPDIAFELKNVTLRDSLYNIHHRELLNIESIYASVSLSSVLRKQAFIEKLTIENGSISMYTNEDNISNTNILKSKEQKTEKETDNPVNHVVIRNVEFSIKNLPKNKDFVLLLNDCDLMVKHTDTGFITYMKSQTHIQSFAFNTDKGSFLKDKNLVTDIQLHYNTDKNELTVPMQTLEIDEAPYQLGGIFYFTDTPYHFNLDISGTEAVYKDILAILTPPISKKLKDISLNKVDSVMVKIIGKMKYKDTPYVKAAFVVKNRTLTIPQGDIKQCSFNGFFMDELVEGNGHGDANSIISIEQLTGNYYGIPFKAEQSTVTHLADPLLKTKISSDFKLPQLNDLIGVSSFKFNSGQAAIRLDCKLELSAKSNLPPNINGTIKFSNTDFSYTPRNLNFKKASGVVAFKHTDVAINNLKLESGPNKITLNATIKNLLNLYYTAPEKVLIACNISSKQIDLAEYISLLGQRATVTATPQKSTSASVRKFAKQLDAIMDESSVSIDLNIDELKYKKFQSKKAHADVVLKKHEISLKKARLNHAGGSLLVNATIRPDNQSNKFTGDAEIKDVNVRKLFYAFGNFGQTAILDSNIEGILSATVKAKGGIEYSGDIVPRSLNGNIKFDLKDGRLIDFEPLGTIGKIIFFNRDLSDIKVAPLKGTLDVTNSNINIRPLLIQTSAFNIFTEGVYGIPTGTNILIQVPLRNPKKDNKHMAVKDLKKGIVINLHATDNNTGKVKIKLGKGR